MGGGEEGFCGVGLIVFLVEDRFFDAVLVWVGFHEGKVFRRTVGTARHLFD